MGHIFLQIPVISSPNSVEDPKIISDFTALQTLVNGNLDATNLVSNLFVGSVLAARATTTNTSAAGGELIQVNAPGVTVTLGTPTGSVLCGVTAVNPTPASPVLFECPGTVFFGGGVYNYPTLVLGAPGTILVMGNGSSWIVLAGEQDTGWVPLTLSGTAGAPGGYTPSVRLKRDMAYLKGELFSTGGSLAAGTTLATNPVAGARPASQLYFSSYSFTTTVIASAITLLSTGEIQMAFGSVDGSSPCLLDGINYSIS